MISPLTRKRVANLVLNTGKRQKRKPYNYRVPQGFLNQALIPGLRREKRGEAVLRSRVAFRRDAT